MPPKRLENEKVVIVTINDNDDKHYCESNKVKKVDTVSGNQKYYTDKGNLEEECYYDSRLNKK